MKQRRDGRPVVFECIHLGVSGARGDSSSGGSAAAVGVCSIGLTFNRWRSIDGIVDLVVDCSVLLLAVVQ